MAAWRAQQAFALADGGSAPAARHRSMPCTMPAAMPSADAMLRYAHARHRAGHTGRPCSAPAYPLPFLLRLSHRARVRMAGGMRAHGAGTISDCLRHAMPAQDSIFIYISYRLDEAPGACQLSIWRYMLLISRRLPLSMRRQARAAAIDR